MLAQTVRLMGPGVEQWVWVSDFYGFGFADLSPRIATTFLELSAKHYPERLGAFLVRGSLFRVCMLPWPGQQWQGRTGICCAGMLMLPAALTTLGAMLSQR